MKKTLISLLVVGMGSLSLTGCWLAAGAVGAEGGYIASQDNRTAGQTIDDQAILASLKTKMLTDPDVSGLKINVDVYQGVVTLRGYVKTQGEVNRAIELANSTSGVKRVDSKLVLDRA